MQLGEDSCTGYLDDNAWIPKALINVEGTKRALSFTYYSGRDREATVLPLYGEAEHHLIVPREFYKKGQFDFEVFDTRPRTYQRTGVVSRIKLDHKRQNDGTLVPTGQTLQRRAVEALLAVRGGILELACGKGKTVIGLEVIARLGMPAIIIVDNMQLMQQWREAIDLFLEVPGGVGMVGDGIFDWGHEVVLATYHTLASRFESLPPGFRERFGVAMFDEAHHVNAPTFSRSADMFYERRYGLTATPKRDDGLHVIHQFHLGPTLFRDLTQDLKPRIYFAWSGFELDLTNPDVVEGTCADGQIHLSKLAVWFGKWRERLEFILKLVKDAREEGRRILVLSQSVDELVNLLALWNGQNALYTDIPQPPLPLGWPQPVRLSQLEQEGIRAAYENNQLRLAGQLDPASRRHLLKEMESFDTKLAMHESAKFVDRIISKQQKTYRDALLAMPSDAGLMIHKVPTEDRMRMLREKKVTFAIMKYGKEGLDEKAIDTTILCEPIGSQSTLQQTMGRGLRYMEGKAVPVYMVVEDNIAPLISMCKKMRRHLRQWPLNDGGPYTYEFLGYPEDGRRKR